MGSWKSKGFRHKDERRIEGFVVSKNAEGDVEELRHDGAADGQIGEFSLLQQSEPGFKGLTPAPSDSGGR
jgi:hypothetical protein